MIQSTPPGCYLFAAIGTPDAGFPGSLLLHALGVCIFRCGCVLFGCVTKMWHSKCQELVSVGFIPTFWTSTAQLMSRSSQFYPYPADWCAYSNMVRPMALSLRGRCSVATLDALARPYPSLTSWLVPLL